MSPVTELTWLLGRILLSVHMRNFSPVDQDRIQETQLTKLVENYGHQFSNN